MPLKKVLICLTLGLVPVASLADECEFIRQALASLPPAGGQVLIPTGVYTCDSPIILDHSHTSLKGVGSVRLKLADRANAPLIIMGQVQTPPTPTTDIEVANLFLDGNKDQQQFECWSGDCTNDGKTTIRNNGISVRGLSDGHVADVSIDGARSGGIVSEHSCYRLKVERLTSMHNYFDGLAGYETYQSLYSDLLLAENQAAGISLDGQFNSNKFDGVQILKNKNVGIFVRESNKNLFVNLNIEDSGSHGIFLAQSEAPNSCPENNIFQNLEVDRSRGAGFRLNDVCRGNRISGPAKFNANQNGCLSLKKGANLQIDQPDQIVCTDSLH